MEASYWARLVRERTPSRRRTLALSGAGLTGAALLAACGGGDKGPALPEDKSGLLHQPKEAGGQQIPGSTLTMSSADYANIDPIRDQIKGANGPPTYVYGRLLKYKIVDYPGTPSPQNVEGDLAESWERSPDGLTYTFKMRPGVKWDRRAPTNGRELTVADIKYSWDKFEELGFNAGDIAKKRNPNSPVESVTTPDSRTAVFKLAFPFVLTESYLAFQRGLQIIPTEAEDKIDLRGEMRGTGAWVMDRWVPSQRWEFSRNPDWYVKGRPYYEKVVRPIVTEYATMLAQIKAGNIDFVTESISSPAVRAEDALSLKAENPKLLMMAERISPAPPSSYAYSYLPGSIFFDVRVRRAVSMLIDKGAYIDTFFNVPAFKQAGLPVEGRWHSHFSAGDPDYYIDPRTKDFGEGGKYFAFDPAEAKKLLQAAGVKPGAEMPVQFSGASSTSARQMQVIAGMLDAGGDFKTVLRPLTADENTQKLLQGKGMWDGIGLVAAFQGNDLDQQLTLHFVPDAAPTELFQNPYPPEFNKFIDMIKKSRIEPDPKKRVDLIKNDLQREMAIQMPCANVPGIADFFMFAQPWVANWNAWRSTRQMDPQELYIHYWYDASKKTA